MQKQLNKPPPFVKYSAAERFTLLDPDLDEPFAKFHEDFWGKESIAEERDAWRKANIRDKATGSEMDVDEGGEPTAVDDQEPDVTDDCCVLDVQSFRKKPIWVRAKYVRIFDACQQRYEAAISASDQQTPSFVITGQPGIGLTTLTQFYSRAHGWQKENDLVELCCTSLYC